MLKKIINIIEQFISNNKKDSNSNNEIKKNKLLSIFNLLGFFIVICFAIVTNYKHTQVDISTNNVFINTIINLRFYILLIFIIIIQTLLAINKAILARAFCLFSFFISVITFSYILNKGIFLEYFLLMTPLFSLIFFEKKIINLIVLIISFIFYFFPNLYFKTYNIDGFNRLPNIILFFTIYLIVNYFKKLSNKNELELLKSKTELEKINDYQSQFFINISHEIRTPLTLIKGEIERLQNYDHQTDTIQNIKQGLDIEVIKINTLVNDVLDLAKYETANFELNLQPINCTQLIKNLYTSFENLFIQKGINFELQPILLNYIINADKKQIEKALSNIIVNASKYTDTSGKVSITIMSAKKNIIVSIKDNGIGIHESDINKISNQFYQAKNHINNSGGSGLGLSLTNKIITSHNGKLEIESELDKGSVFKIILPLTEILPLSTNSGQDKETLSKPILNTKIKTKKEKTFLIVEDNIKMSAFIIRLLNKEGYACTVTTNGIEALEQLKNDKFNFIITDYMMPKMDGFDFISALRKKQIDTPVLMLTARNDNDSRKAVFRLGIDDYITKPFEPSEFIIRVKNTLNNYEIRTSFIEEEKITTKETKENNTWITLVNDFIIEKCSDTDFKQIDIAENFNISESTLYRKIKNATGLTPNTFIQEVKLQKAKQILEEQPFILLKQLSREIGYSHQSHFSKIYEKRFGVRPCKH